MSSANKTANLKLSQYVGTDKPSYLVDYNSDMQKIDSGYGDIKSIAQTAKSTADTANSTATGLSSQISQINTDITEVNEDVSNLKNRTASLTGSVNTGNVSITGTTGLKEIESTVKSNAYQIGNALLVSIFGEFNAKVSGSQRLSTLLDNLRVNLPYGLNGSRTVYCLGNFKSYVDGVNYREMLNMNYTQGSAGTFEHLSSLEIDASDGNPFIIQFQTLLLIPSPSIIG